VHHLRRRVDDESVDAGLHSWDDVAAALAAPSVATDELARRRARAELAARLLVQLDRIDGHVLARDSVSAVLALEALSNQALDDARDERSADAGLLLLGIAEHAIESAYALADDDGTGLARLARTRRAVLATTRLAA
jgi:hypothetical protein